MKDRINRVKQYVLNHQKEIIVGAGAITLGWMIGTKLQTKHTFLSITPEELQTLLDDPTLHAHYEVAKRNMIHLSQIPSRV